MQTSRDPDPFCGVAPLTYSLEVENEGWVSREAHPCPMAPAWNGAPVFAHVLLVNT